MTNIQKNIFIVILLLATFLRFYRLDQIPPSLFSDEVDLGYQAYSVLKTGKDYQGNFLPIHFQSFADFRSSLYIYSSLPTLAIFGLNEWGIRIPAAFFGVLSLAGLFLLIKKLGFNYWIALCSVFLLSISPWHLHYSRAGFEVTLMMALLVWGTALFLIGLAKKPFLIAGTILIFMSIYSYSTAKLFVPVFALGLIIIYRKQLLRLSGKFKLVWTILLLLVILPFGFDLLRGQAAYRFSYTSIFADPTIPKEVDVNRLIDSRDKDLTVGTKSTLISKILHNKFISFGDVFLKNYMFSYSTNFLFIQGDYIGRHSVGKMGEFYFMEAIFAVAGLFFLFRSASSKSRNTILLWLLFSPVPSALTVEGGGHATRLFLLLVPLYIINGLGFYNIWQITRKASSFKRMIFLVFAAAFIFNIYFYFHRYWVHYSSEQERLWHYGFKQVITEAQNLKGQFKRIVFTTSTEPPLIFILFWTGFDPLTFQQKKIEYVTLPDFGTNIPKIDKFYLSSLPQKLDIQKLADVIKSDMLVIVNRKDLPIDLRKEKIKGIKTIDTIEYPSGEVAFYLLTHE